MSDDPNAQQCKQYASRWVKQDGLKELLSTLELPRQTVGPLREAVYYAENYKSHVAAKVNQNFVGQKMQPFLKG